jgi:hypothetical protein
MFFALDKVDLEKQQMLILKVDSKLALDAMRDEGKF